MVEAAGAEATPRPVHRSLMQQLNFQAMGSKMLAILDLEQPAPTLNDVPLWFEEWEQALSRFRIDSELTRLNAAAGSPISVSETLWDVLRAALDAERWTDGLVNPLILEDLVHAGYDRPFEQLQADLRLDPGRLTHDAYWLMQETVELPALSRVIVDQHTRTVCLLPGTGLDFGGVAKGWAAHQAVQRLGAAAPALVSAGGDVAVSGPRADGEPWRISVEDPFKDDGYLEMLYIESGGVATSGKDHRHWQRGGLFQHHIIDPRTRQPAVTDILAATVVASSVMRAEALAKAVVISGSRAGLELLNEHTDAEAMLVLDDGSTLYSTNFGTYL